jgi:hypothetical protein
VISGSWPGPAGIPSPTPASGADVPQLTAAQAAQYTVASYLAGWWPAPKGGAADWTEERGARNER